MADSPGRQGAWPTIKRGLSLSPELRRGLPGTLALALVATSPRSRSQARPANTVAAGFIFSSNSNLFLCYALQAQPGGCSTGRGSCSTTAPG